MFRNQYSIANSTKIAIGEICEFIIRFYVKAWFTCPFETVDRGISKVSVKKLCNNLLYLTEEIAALSFFTHSIYPEVKCQMVETLKIKVIENPTIRLII